MSWSGWALRAEPRLGLAPGELTVWLALAMACGLVIALPAAAVASLIGRRQVGLVVAALLVVPAVQTHTGTGVRARGMSGE